MAGFWVTEALPLPVTALIPMVLFPLMGILDSDKTSLCYLKETNMMFVGGLIIAIAVEYCNLHRRVALYVILTVGCSPRKLNFGLVAVSMFVSMWISNTAAIAMMCPIIDATLKELESQGIGSFFEPLPAVEDGDVKDHPAKATKDEGRRPTKTTICYFLGAAYAASIGGMGCIVGSGTNLTFKGIYETKFPDGPGVEFAAWMFLNVPIMLITMFLTWLWLQILFMGLFRPKSADAQAVKLGKQGEVVAAKLIRQKLEEMGPMSFHEGAVGCMFILAVFLWFFRKPQFIPGWAEMITDTKVKDATAALIVVMLLFIIPAKPNFIYFFSKDESKRPTVASPPLITWKVAQQKLPWGLIFLLGGGFALAEGSSNSGMSKLIAVHLGGLAKLPKFSVMLLASVFASFLTEFSSNVAVANVILPVLAEISINAQWHPMYLMMPAALACSHAFCLPVGTPPNAIAAAPCNMPTKEMVKAGLGVSLIAMVILLAIFPWLGEPIFGLSEFPVWAGGIANATNSTG
ncbi:solute carrier family 13 member [Holotrichia oblita]|uniref:Solute carrier family 13 member n=2 Tax=Holotrichia oblita TaxID=644536 RepID=A0ACB9SH98_HOLOL|nr:solute carrier family 13 member [Holotrichia oblita]KAI4454387.1 solute carrier family 13 member [Holotrichia oblita]